MTLVTLTSVALARGGNGSSANHGVDMDGVIDEAAVYDHALSPERIAEHWTIGRATR